MHGAYSICVTCVIAAAYAMCTMLRAQCLLRTQKRNTRVALRHYSAIPTWACANLT